MIAQLQKHVRLWFLTAIALLAAVPPAIARDFTYEYAGQTLTYTVLSEEDKTCETKQGANNYSGNYVRGEVIIPECVFDGADTYTVTTIGENSFYYQTGLTSVKIPNTVITIGSNAFYRCEDLTSIEIPSSVTIIGDKAFTSCTGLTSIEIHNSVTTIGSFAFWNCKALTSIEIPSSVTTIGERAFAECYGLTSIEIPSSVTSIGSSAFQSCTSLSSVIYNCDVTGNNLFLNSPVRDFTFGGAVVPDEMVRLLCINSVEDFTFSSPVTTIGERAFSGISGLTSIEIPNTVTTIGESAFSGSPGLTSIEIPSTVTTIGKNAFWGCSNLTSVINNSDAYAIDMFVNSPVSDLTIGGTIVPDFMARDIGVWESLKRLTLTDKVIAIGEHAFDGCTGLISVKIPNTVITIGSNAFKSCVGLTSVGLPGSVTTIGNKAFYGCTGLTSVAIPNSVKTIGESAFWGCTGLNSIEIPSSVTTIGEWAFARCSNLTSVVYNSDACESSIFTDSPVSDLTIGMATVPELMAHHFGIVPSLIRLSFADKVTTIGRNAFSGCASLTSVDLPGSVTTLGNSAFYGCAGLTSATIPNSVTTIGESAFSGCTGLTSIEIPSSVTTIGGWAFAGCSNLTSVVYNSEACESGIFKDSPVSDLTIGMTTVPKSMATHFGIVASLIRLSFTDKVTTIGEDAFNGCVGLTSVDLPGSVTTLGNSAFYGCTGLTSIEIPSSVTTIGKWAFEGCDNIETITFASVTPPEANQNEFSELWRSARIVIPGDALTTYLDFAPYNRFYKWGTVEEPEGHSDGVFAYVFTENPPAAYIMADESYREAGPALTVPLRTNKGTTIYPIKGILPGAFHYCTNLNSVKIGNNVELIGYNAFASCNALTSVEIPNSVITIGGGAFNGCSGLTSIEIPNSVTTIGDTAFSNCYGLTSLEIPNSVATIGYGAFMGNYKVSELTLGSGLKTIGVAAFQGCTRITDVVIPPFVTEIGASAFAGTGLKTVKIGCRVTSIGANAFAQVNDMTGIYVTAMAPPTAENTSFSNYSMPLYVVPGTISLYENASPCWYRFYDDGSISEQTPVTEVTVEDMLLAGAKPGDTFQIKSGVVPAEATLPHLFYVSSNPDVVQVTHEGLVTIMEPQATNDEEIETYSYREPADVEIRVYSMYDDVAPAVIKFDISTGVDDIVIGDASGEIDRSLPYEVYNLNGQMVGTDRSNLANGIYIVRQGSKVQKIAVK
jgi:hypothetical protein